MISRSSLAAIAGATLLSTAASAAPTFQQFGDLSDAGPNAPVTFGGSGIPDANTAIANIEANQLSGLIGLTITPRYSAPAPVVVSDGVFQVQAGTETAGCCTGSLWNFSFYADILDGVDYELLYDFDPSAGTDYGILQIDSSFFIEDGAYQNSQNPLFAYLSDGSLINTPPATFDFDADVDGLYNLRLAAYDSLSSELLGEVAVDVIVGDGPQDVPAPAALGLLGLGVAGLSALRRRRNV